MKMQACEKASIWYLKIPSQQKAVESELDKKNTKAWCSYTNKARHDSDNFSKAIKEAGLQ